MKIWNASLAYLRYKACMLHHNNHALAKQRGSPEANAHKLCTFHVHKIFSAIN